MIAFDVGRQRFQLRAAAVCLHDGHVLLHRPLGDAHWSLPGGRVEMQEDAAATLRREMQEELGAAVECGPLLYVVENFFDLGGRAHHELGLCFLAHFSSDSPLRDTRRSFHGSEGGRPLEFRWFDRTAIATADIRPAFLRQTLSQRELRFEHVVHRDGSDPHPPTQGQEE